MTKRDRELGRDIEITRRDFLDGVALALGGTVASSLAGSARVNAETAAPGAASPQPAAFGQGPTLGAASADATNYPPMLTGMRGQNDAAVNAGHAVRDGRAPAAQADTGELYDLVVVGAGMAGLA